MGDDRHGDFRHGGGRDGARAGCSRASPGAPACGKHGCHDLRCPSPSQGDAPGRPRWPPAEPGPRPRASVPDALPGRAQRWPAAGTSWRRTRNGQNPRPHKPAGGRRPGPCRERWRHSSPRPPPSQRAGRLPFGLQQLHLHGQLPDPLHRGVQFRLHRIALAFLERGSYPGDRLLTPLLEPENLHAQLPRQEFHRLATQKPQGNLTLARSPSTAGQVPAGLPAKPGLGKTWTSRARPRLPQAHQQQLSSQNCRSCSGPPWTLRLRQFCVQGNRVRLSATSGQLRRVAPGRTRMGVSVLQLEQQ